ncbi:DUF2975 domain-containing protein [Roseiterribacter gracilis]|uniref:DUF2975 domain-containing protein n=1 Tax=Roseiterribacter gracilis TaxID=2812848 RepID=UPI003B431A52
MSNVLALTQVDETRLAKTSRRLAVCFTFFGVAALVAPVVAALLVGRNSNFTIDEYWVKNLPAEISALQRVALMIAGVVLALPSAFACKAVRDLFRLYARGEFFATENINCLRRIARALLWTAASVMLGGGVMSAIAALPKHEINIMLGVRGTDLILFAVAGVVYAIAHVMELARDAEEERSQFV